jgi:hypothetical protein
LIPTISLTPEKYSTDKKGTDMKKWSILIALCVFGTVAMAQDERDDYEKRGFKTENIFTGGSVSLSFGSSYFSIGASPVLGYKIAEWIDAGIVANYDYTSWRDYNVYGDKLRQNMCGGGLFTRLYPVHFLFAQAQAEHNFIALKYIPEDGSTPSKSNTSANSLLIGAGVAQGRIRGFNDAFFYFALMVDVSGNELSPYTDNRGNARPIYRAGINVYPFRRQF